MNCGAKFVCGFFDGDGCVTLQNSRGRYSATLYFSQSHDEGPPPELQYIKGIYGGVMIEKTKRAVQHRRRWELRFFSRSAVIGLLMPLEKGTIVKKPQVKIALAYAQSGGDGAVCLEMIRQARAETNAIDVNRTQIDGPYLAGLFAAEGTVGLLPSGKLRNLALRAAISQRSCFPLLRVIAEYLGAGRVENASGAVVFSSRQALGLFEEILPYLLGQKREQVVLAYSYQHSREPTESEPQKRVNVAEVQQLSQRLKRLKRR